MFFLFFFFVKCTLITTKATADFHSIWIQWLSASRSWGQGMWGSISVGPERVRGKSGHEGCDVPAPSVRSAPEFSACRATHGTSPSTAVAGWLRFVETVCFSLLDSLISRWGENHLVAYFILNDYYLYFDGYCIFIPYPMNLSYVWLWWRVPSAAEPGARASLAWARRYHICLQVPARS